MSSSWRDGIRDWLPPKLLRWWRRRNANLIQFKGNYDRFQTALLASEGYDSELIFNRVCEAQRAVQAGNGAYAQDGVVFPTMSAPWRLFSILMKIATQKMEQEQSCKTTVNVVDFGGALGSSYDRCRAVCPANVHLNWNIIEQENLVRVGQAEFSTASLSFHSTVQELNSSTFPDLILLSGVLPYLESPYKTLAELTTQQSQYLVLDRTPLLFTGADRLTVQHVPASIYGKPVCYPAWFLDFSKLSSLLSPKYELLSKHESGDGEFDLGDIRSTSYGMIWKLKQQDAGNES